MFLGVNMCLARLRVMSSDKSQKHIYTQEHQLYYYYNNFRGHLQKESTTVQVILNAAGVATAFILRIVFIQSSAEHAKFVKIMFASKFSKGK